METTRTLEIELSAEMVTALKAGKLVLVNTDDPDTCWPINTEEAPDYDNAVR